MRFDCESVMKYSRSSAGCAVLSGTADNKELVTKFHYYFLSSTYQLVQRSNLPIALGREKHHLESDM